MVILGSLNEGTWPQAADPGPWLNRPMRQALGLPAPEERIGDAAHIFTSLLGVAQVYLTRAAKIDGVPTVPSRWLLRLQALLAGVGHAAHADRPWLAWARERNALAGPARPVRAPEPRPALALRPRQLSATTIERWIGQSVRRVRRAHPGARGPAGARPAARRGAARPDRARRAGPLCASASRIACREDIRAELVALARAGLEELAGAPRVAAFWAPRFARFAEWFADTECARRAGVQQTLAEVEGAIVLAGPAGPFTLKARADRIDVGDGGLVITDYKTGNVKDLAGRAAQGRAPQLPLEAAIAVAGGFAGLPAQEVAGLRYISASAASRRARRPRSTPTSAGSRARRATVSSG